MQLRSRAWLLSVLRPLPGFALVQRMTRARARRRRFQTDFELFRSRTEASGPRGFDLDWRRRQPCLDDKTPTTSFDRHYVYHLAWAARIVARTRPSEHVDISSNLHFCTLISAFTPVRFYDYRPATLILEGLTADRADLLNLPFGDGAIESLSCMHVVEHVGLGRYGDPIDPGGDLRAINELQRVLAPGGSLLFVVPVGRPSIRFNAHRIYSYRQVVGAFEGLTLREWALIEETGSDGLIVNAPERLADAEEYACGCFWFQKPHTS
jgi:SAM-dependent methyltransferase